MKLFAGSLLLCFAAGILLRKRSFRASVLFLVMLTIVVTIGYFYFGQI